MISVKEATRIINSTLFIPRVQTVQLQECIGLILAEEIKADRDLPPFDRITMDGIALSFKEYVNGQREFSIEGVQAAGKAPLRLKDSNGSIEVMTGALLPIGTDTVIPYENITINNSIATLSEQKISEGQNIHQQGQDAKKSDILLRPGVILSPAEVALLASVGKNNVVVYEFPKTAIISTGDELVDVDQNPLPYQIRKSNSYSLQASLKQLGCASTLFHLKDNKEEIEKELSLILSNYDLIILSGGISKGKFDFVPLALESLGIKKQFHQVAQKPGKPLWFGCSKNKFVFALPGNPVSTYLCFYKYVKLWLMKSLKAEVQESTAILAKDYIFNSPLTYFLQVQTKNESGKLMAYPIAGGGSGDFANLKDVDGFLELPKEKSEFKVGEAYTIIQFR